MSHPREQRCRRKNAGSFASLRMTVLERFPWVSRLRLVQRLRAVDHPLGKFRGALRGLAHGDRPVVEPARAFFAHVGVGEAVGLITQRVFERDETVSALA